MGFSHQAARHVNVSDWMSGFGAFGLRFCFDFSRPFDGSDEYLESLDRLAPMYEQCEHGAK
jgi:hypothetical protein